MPKFRVLMIDDEPSVLKALEDYLMPDDTVDAFLKQYKATENPDEKITFDISTALSGEEGEQVAASAFNNQTPFRLAIVDMRMPPGIDGFETIQRLRRIDPNIHIVVFSAYSDYSEQDLYSIPGDGRVACVRKPRMKELVDTVEQILKFAG